MLEYPVKPEAAETLEQSTIRFRPAFRPVDESNSNPEVYFSLAEATVGKDDAGDAHIYLNEPGMQLFAEIYRAVYPRRQDIRFDGITLHPGVAENLARNIYTNYRFGRNHVRKGYKALFQSLRKAIDDPVAPAAITLVNADARFSDEQVRTTEGEEAFHRAVAAATYSKGISPDSSKAALQASEPIQRAAETIKRLRPYLDNVIETFEEIAAGIRNGEWAKLGLSAAEAADVWQQFLDVIAGDYGKEQASSLIRNAHPDHAGAKPRVS